MSWQTIINKRNNFRIEFDNFNPEIIISYDEQKIEELMNNAGIIRNRLKINSAVINSQKYFEVQQEFGTFAKYIWQFTDHKVINNEYRIGNGVPTRSIESDNMSKDLKKRGFKFVGTTICYAFMQAAGMINDHEVDCFRYNEIVELSKILSF